MKTKLVKVKLRRAHIFVRKATGACKIVCSAIASDDGEKLFHAHEKHTHREERTIVFERRVAFQKPDTCALLKALCVEKKIRQCTKVSTYNLG